MLFLTGYAWQETEMVATTEKKDAIVDIEVNKGVTLSQLSQWNVPPFHTARFVLHQESSFAPLAEGVALGLLRSWKQDRCRFYFKCSYDVRAFKRLEGTYGIFDSLFGMAVLDASV